MGLCDTPDKIIKKRPPRKRKTSKGYGRNAGHRYRGKPKMEYAVIDWTKASVEVGNSVVVTIPAPTHTVGISNETHEMWDTHGYIQNWYNPLVKEDFRVGSLEVEPWKETFTGPDGETEVELLNFNSTSPSIRDSIRATLPFLDNAEIDELSLRSEEKLSQVVDSEVSIANFIIELIQLCTGNVKSITRFSDVYSRAVKAYHEAYKRFLKQGHKEASARWLAWNFAIKPAIKDLKAILCSISSAYKKMKWLQDHNHKIVHLNYIRKDLADRIDFDPNEYVTGDLIANILCHTHPLMPNNGTFYQQIRFVEIDVHYQARSKIFLEIPDKYLKGMYGMNTLWAAMQGLHNPVGIIWEAIPFSWLIDYFLSYRARLWQQMFDYNPYNEGVTVLGFGHSFRIKVVGDARIQNVVDDSTYHSYGQFKYVIKWRTAGLPQAESTTLFRVPDTWYQGSIIGALVIGKHQRRR